MIDFFLSYRKQKRINMLEYNKYANTLILSSNEKAWKKSSTHGTEFDKYYKKKFKPIWDQVWKRDKNTCYYCGFQAQKFQEIHHLNDDHEDNSMDNLVTVCPLCHQSHHLDTVSNTNGGKIIWLPELCQQDLNHLCRAIFVAMYHAEQAEKEKREVSGFVKIAKLLETSLLERHIEVEKYIHNGASDPVNLASALIAMTEEQYDNRTDFLKNLKLLHVKTRFSVQSKYWARNTFASIPIDTWLNILPDEKKEEAIEEIKNENDE